MRRRAESGQSLPEVLFSALLLGLAALGIFMIMITGRRHAATDDVRASIAGYAASLQAKLQSYVTADTSVAAGAPGDPPWHLPEDSCGSCWALRPGSHDVTALLPASLRRPPYNARLAYVVSEKTVNGHELSEVRIQADWSAPP